MSRNRSTPRDFSRSFRLSWKGPGWLARTPLLLNDDRAILPHLPTESTVDGQQSRAGCGSSPTYDLPPTNYLSFQQHSRFRRVTTFVFYNIPALPWAAEAWSFVFIDIPALVLHFLKLLVFPFPVGGDILSMTAMPANIPLHLAPLKCSRQ